jgi:hypothetical protein
MYKIDCIQHELYINNIYGITLNGMCEYQKYRLNTSSVPDSQVRIHR